MKEGYYPLEKLMGKDKEREGRFGKRERLVIGKFVQLLASLPEAKYVDTACRNAIKSRFHVSFVKLTPTHVDVSAG